MWQALPGCGEMDNDRNALYVSGLSCAGEDFARHLNRAARAGEMNITYSGASDIPWFA